ncbi:MAG: hypothetical protein IJP16_09910 [Clostridia bacterium]|nr:hypothetical protein [Clostridia bacterium]
MKRILLLFLLVLLLTSCGKIKPPSEEVLESLDSFVEDNGGIFEASDGTLISLYPHHEESAYTDDYNTIRELADSCELPVYVAIPPRKMDALISLLPQNFPVEHTEYLYLMAEDIIGKSDAVYVDLYKSLRDNLKAYFKTDHHWSDEGAYIAYTELCSAMGLEAVPRESIATEVLIENYQGSDHTKKPESTATDTVTGPLPEGEYMTELVRFPYDSQENNIPFESFYDYSQLETLEKYGVFLGGNEPYIRVTRVGEERECLLIIRDSFASALVPYLACHFDIVLIDPRFYPEGISKAAEREEAFAILVIENMGSVTESEIKIKW